MGDGGLARRANGETRQDILDYVKEYIRRNGFGPTAENIAAAVGLEAKNSVTYHLNILIKQGALEREGERRMLVLGRRAG